MLKIIPPILVGILMLVMIPTTILCPGQPMFPSPYQWSGLAVVVLGVFFLLSGHRTFMERGSEIHTFKIPRNLVTSGVFQVSRNPMYLGFLLILLGVAVCTNEALNLFYAFAFFLVANYWYIPTEERNAQKVFGELYEVYQNRVRRWL
jgi:protein-S-isoprenylcysteine O-methyltransferase Ste14